MMLCKKIMIENFKYFKRMVSIKFLKHHMASVTSVGCNGRCPITSETYCSVDLWAKLNCC